MPRLRVPCAVRLPTAPYVLGASAFDQFEAAADAGEQVVEVMSDAASQPSTASIFRVWRHARSSSQAVAVGHRGAVAVRTGGHGQGTAGAVHAGPPGSSEGAGYRRQAMAIAADGPVVRWEGRYLKGVSSSSRTGRSDHTGCWSMNTCSGDCGSVGSVLLAAISRPTPSASHSPRRVTLSVHRHTKPAPVSRRDICAAICAGPRMRARSSMSTAAAKGFS